MKTRAANQSREKCLWSVLRSISFGDWLVETFPASLSVKYFFVMLIIVMLKFLIQNCRWVLLLPTFLGKLRHSKQPSKSELPFLTAHNIYVTHSKLFSYFASNCNPAKPVSKDYPSLSDHWSRTLPQIKLLALIRQKKITFFCGIKFFIANRLHPLFFFYSFMLEGYI